MTDPSSEVPANALDQARELLADVLAETFTAIGWTAERVSPFAVITPQVPGAWVDVPTLSRQGNGLVATFPLGIAVDGTAPAQVKRVTGLIAMLWERLEAVRIPADLLLPEGSTLDVMTAGPAEFEIGGGPTTRALALVVQIPIAPRTLCPSALTDPSGDTAP